MKRIISFILIFSILFTSLGFSFNNVYGNNNNIEPDEYTQSLKEKKYVEQLDSISKQLEILSSNVLDKITNNQDKKILIKDATFIKSQIRSLRSELSEYHKTESGDIEKNPISLALLNTLNYYSMSLSYLFGVLEYTDSSSESKYLQDFFRSKSSGDSTLLWVKEQVNK